MPQASQSECVYSGAERVVAVGDLHGNHAGLVRILTETGLIDAEGRWRARNTHLVQMGDVLGRGGEPGKIFVLLRRLEAEAPAFGSRVHLLLGNHEAMSIRGVLRYNTLEEFRDLAAETLTDEGDWTCAREGARESDRKAAPRDGASAPGRVATRREGDPDCGRVAACREGDPERARKAAGGAEGSDRGREAAGSAGGADPAAEKFGRRLDMMGAREFHALLSPRGKIGSWLAAHDSAVAIDGHLFVHGGLDRTHGRMPLAELNARVREDLAREDGDEGAGMLRREGPQWNREYLLKPARGKGEELREVLGYHGCLRMVVGHTPTSCIDPDRKGRIIPLYGGALYCIDTGIGLAYGGRLSALIVEGGKAFPRYFG